MNLSGKITLPQSKIPVNDNNKTEHCLPEYNTANTMMGIGKTTWATAGCVVLFLLPFAGVGVFMSYLIFSDLIGWMRMQSWVETPARIIHAELEESPGSEGGSTYSVAAEYEYRFNGRRYQSNSVTRYIGSDSIGNFHKGLFNELNACKTQNTFCRCFVNPDNPSQAIISRKIRVEMILFYSAFAVTFGGVGFGLMGAMGYEIFRAWRKAGLAKLYPGQPWMWRQDWSRREVHSTTMFKIILSSGTALVICAMSFPFLTLILPEMKSGNYGVLVVLIFPLIGSLVAAWAIRCILRWQRFGSSKLLLSVFPARPGDRLSGIIKTGANLPDSSNIELELRCQKKITEKSGKKTSTVMDDVWSEKRTAMGMPGADGKTSIQVDFEIPDHLPQSGEVNEREEVKWILEARADIPGVDLDLSFEVPVFQTSMIGSPAGIAT